MFIIVFLHFHSFGSKLAHFHGMKMRKIIAYKIGISFSLFLCNSTIPYLLHLRCKSYVNPIQIPYNSYSRLDLNWSWIGLGLELPRAYIEEETRINFGLPMIFFITTKQKKVFSRFSCHTVILVVYQRVMRDRKNVLLSHCRHKVNECVTGV